MRIDENVTAYVPHMKPGQAAAGIIIANQPLSVARRRFNQHHVTGADRGNARRWPACTREELRPVARQIKPRVGQAEIFPQPAAAVSMRTVAWAPTNNGAFIHGHDDTALHRNDARATRGGGSGIANYATDVGKIAGGVGMNFGDVRTMVKGTALSGTIENDNKYSKHSNDQTLHP